MNERPGAIPDLTALAIEPEPLRDRRPERFFRFEPFAPVGVRIGSFLLFPEAETGLAATNNLFRSSTDQRSDVALDVRPAARLVSTWAVHALELRGSGLASFHDRFPSEDDRAYALEARGRLDVTRRMNVEGLASYQLEQETRGSLDAPSAAASRADVTTSKAFVAANHSFNRLSVQLRGGITDIVYGPVTAASGGTLSNADRDLSQREATARATWEFKPTLLAFAEAGGNAREHKAAPVSDGISRDSTGERWRLGVSFGSTGPRLRGEASLGYGVQRPDDARLAAVDGVLIDANLAWRLSELTSVLLSAQTDFGETTVAGSGGALARIATVELRHAFQRHFVGTAGLAYAMQDYAEVGIRERELRPSIGIEYFLSREAVLFGRYQHIAFDSTEPGRDYEADEVRVGLRLRR